MATRFGTNSGETVNGTVDDDAIFGFGGDDTLNGLSGDDVIDGGAGNDTIDGGTGIDRAVYSAAAAIVASGGGWKVTDSGGTDTLMNIEIVHTDGTGKTLLVGNGGYLTIQQAVNAAEDGDTILVAPGLYVETVTVNKDVTIRGANTGIAGNGTRGAESEIVGGIIVTADGVTIDGLKISGSTTAPGHAVPAGVIVEGDDFTLVNSLLQLAVEATEEVEGVLTATVTGLDIGYNKFDGYTTGVYLGGGGTTGSVHNNLFQGDSSEPAAPTGMQSGVSSETSHTLIKDNTFDGLYGGVINLFPYGPETVDINSYVMGNIFTDNLATRPIQIYPTPETHNFIGTDVNETFHGYYAGTTPVSFDGRGGNDNVYGSDADDNLKGGEGNDVVVGGPGNDMIDGGSGDDTMEGSAGNDTFYVDSFGDAVIELAGEGTDEVRTAIGSRTDFTMLYTLPANVENLTGTSTGNQGVRGNALDNVINMGVGNDLVVVDTGGNDTVNGGGGNDFIYYGSAFTNADSNDGGAGTDTLGLNGNYVITFDSNDLANIERLSLASGGSAGTSSYDITTTDASVGAAGLTVIATTLGANETLIFTGTAETNGAFNVQSGAGADRISGGAQNDTLNGGGGDDFLLGRGGDDILIGGAGADSLRGGFGKDTYVYRAVSESTFEQSDTILDMEKGDKIDLSAIDANSNASDGDTAFTYIGAANFTGQRGELRVYEAVKGTWFAVGDVDGDGVGDLYIQIKTPSALVLDASNFVL